MMGRSHAIFGAACALALSTSAHVTVGEYSIPLGVGLVEGGLLAPLVCAFAGAGAALLPDLDQRSSTASLSLPPLTTALSAVVAAISGGHRKGTHYLLTALAACAGVCALLAHPLVVTAAGRPFNVTLAVLLALMGALAWRATHVRFGPVSGWVAALVVAVAAGWSIPGPALWVGVAWGAGLVSHAVGDILTTQPVRWLWPSPLMVNLPLLGNAGSTREKVLSALLAVYVVVVLAAAIVTRLVA